MCIQKYNVVRNLIFKKQHYMDKYPKIMKSRYTCWGYYDGLDVELIEDNQPPLFFKKSNALVSPMWNAAKSRIRAEKGYYSTQNIGIFRFCKDETEWEKEKEFWDESYEYPYLIIGFIQIKDSSKTLKIAKSIEDNFSDAYAEGHISTEKTRKIYVYETYDNADLVLIAKGNSIHDMMTLSNRISNDDITYFHTVAGVAEAFLTAFKAAKRNTSKADFYWKPESNSFSKRKCFVYEDVDLLTIRLVSNGNSCLLKALANKLKEFSDKDPSGIIRNYKEAVYNYQVGHYDSEIMIPNTDVFGILKLVSEGAPGTHQNTLYEKGLYNIETYFSVSQEPFSALVDDSPEPPSNIGNITNTCKAYIDHCIGRMKRSDENLCACYMGMINTLNSLSQHERFSLSRNMFAMIFPALQLFMEQLERAEEDLDKKKREEDRFFQTSNDIQNSIKTFLECVNSVLQHTIHTEQRFLMAPGLSGTEYSIPVKLALMYHSVLSSLTKILNDSQNQYRYIFQPVMETKPETSNISPNPGNRSHLIKIAVSQRTLYAPRHLMIILCHEVGHYVGDKIRNRSKRLFYAFKDIVAYVSKKICDDGISSILEILLLDRDLSKGIADEFQGVLFNRIEHYLEQVIATDIKLGRISQKRLLYSKGAKEEMLKIFTDILLEEDGCIDDCIMNWFTARILKEKHRDHNLALQVLVEIQRSLMDKKKAVLSNLEGFIDDIFQMYSEIFCDITANEVLTFDRADYVESFSVSEGYSIEADLSEKELSSWTAPNSQIIRQWVIDNIYYPSDLEKYSKEVQNYIIYNDLYSDNMIEYGKQCKEKICECVDTHKAEVYDIRGLYNCFDNYKRGAAEIFENILKINEKYLNITLP